MIEQPAWYILATIFAEPQPDGSVWSVGPDAHADAARLCRAGYLTQPDDQGPTFARRWVITDAGWLEARR